MRNRKNVQNQYFLAIGLSAMLVVALASGQSKRLTIHPTLAAASVVVQDSFTGPDGAVLETRSTNTGQNYLRPKWSENGTINLWHGWAYHGSTGFRSTYLANVQLPADQYAQISITFKGDGVTPELKLRADPASEIVLQGGYDPANQRWFLEANEGYAGPDPVLYKLGASPETIGVGAQRLLRIEAVGYAVRLYVDNALRIEAALPEEAEYNLGGPGFSGFSLAGKSTTSGTFIDNFEAGNLGGASPTPTPSPVPSPSPTPGCTTWRLSTDTPTRKIWDCN